MILGRQSGLGRGLGAIIPPKSPPTPQPSTASSAPVPDFSSTPFTPSEIEVVDSPQDQIQHLPVALIDPNPHQPREYFDHAGLEELVSSIRVHGVMQPIIVTQKEHGRYELIAGERRLRASKIAGQETIPAIIRTVTDQQKLELAIIENIQREDLNPLEEAIAFDQLQKEFQLTQEEIAEKVGKSRSQVANIIRLLQLSPEIQEALRKGLISQSNARTLLGIEGTEERLKLFHEMLTGNWTTRQIEARIPRKRTRRILDADPNMVKLEEELRGRLGVKVRIKRDPRGEGEICITFLNDEDLMGVVNKIGGRDSEKM